MNHVAQALAAQGRNGDSVLVHMTPAEVGGLQSLAKSRGTSLTINPTTGLPEAFSLGSLLPMAAMFIPGMGPLASMALSAGLSGVGAMIDGKDPLQAAAMGGLTSGVTNGLSAAMTPAADAATNAAMTSGAGLTSAANGVGGGALDFGAMNGVTSNLKDAAALTNQATQASTVPMAEQAAQTSSGILNSGVPNPAWAGQAPNFNPAAASPSVDITQAAATGMDPSIQAGNDLLGPQQLIGPMGGAQAAEDPSLLQRGITWAKENPWKTAGLAGAGILGLNALSSHDAPPKPEDKWNYDPKKTGSTALTPEQAAYNATTKGEKYYSNPNYGYYAGGGLLGLPGARDSTKVIPKAHPHLLDRKPVPMEPKAPQFLKGGGDGMSDSIHGTIDGKEPVKLASNEYVMPADVVSHLGNGSSSAGAKHLDRVVKKVRKDRTGTTKQAPQVNPTNYLPI